MDQSQFSASEGTAQPDTTQHSLLRKHRDWTFRSSSLKMPELQELENDFQTQGPPSRKQHLGMPTQGCMWALAASPPRDRHLLMLHSPLPGRNAKAPAPAVCSCKHKYTHTHATAHPCLQKNRCGYGYMHGHRCVQV